MPVPFVTKIKINVILATETREVVLLGEWNVGIFFYLFISKTENQVTLSK